MKQAIVVIFLCYINIPTLSMQHINNKNPLQHPDILPKIIAVLDHPEKNIIRSVCKQFKNTSSKNNFAIYLCNPIILQEKQKVYALQLALYHRNLPAVENLSSLGFKIKNKMALSQYNDPFMIQIKPYMPTTHPQYIIASFLGDIDFLQEYCANEKNKINDQLTEDKSTALHYAAIMGHEECVRILLKHPEIDLSILDIHGITPTAYAIREEHWLIAKLLGYTGHQ